MGKLVCDDHLKRTSSLFFTANSENLWTNGQLQSRHTNPHSNKDPSLVESKLSVSFTKNRASGNSFSFMVSATCSPCNIKIPPLKKSRKACYFLEIQKTRTLPHLGREFEILRCGKRGQKEQKLERWKRVFGVEMKRRHGYNHSFFCLLLTEYVTCYNCHCHFFLLPYSSSTLCKFLKWLGYEMWVN